MQSQETELAAMMVRLRTPLARIELAASQLLRAASTPGGVALSAGISEAVNEIDEQIAMGLQSLVGEGAASTAPEDCRPIIEALRQRMEPVLRARSIEWLGCEDSEPREPVMGPAHTTRGAALALLQSAMKLAAPGGRISLSLDHRSRTAQGHYGVVLRVEREDAASHAPALEFRSPGAADPFDALRGFVRATGSELEIRETPESVGAVVWIGPEEESCIA